MKNLVSVFSLIYYACKILLLVVLFQWWMGDAFASSDLNVSSAGDLTDQRDFINLLGDDTYEFKKSITCHDVVSGNDPYLNLRAGTNYFVCPDGTASFPQPDSTGTGGWNGYCGQTAVSNLAGMLCGRYFSPQTVDSYATDVTPGNLPATNLRALKKIFTESYSNVRRPNPCPDNGSWKGHSAWSAQGFIDNLKTAVLNGPGQVVRKRNNGTRRKITPVAVLVARGISKLHWLTIVDFQNNPQDHYGCDAVVNTWGNQKIITCDNLAAYGNTLLMGYSYLTFER